MAPRHCCAVRPAELFTPPVVIDVLLQIATACEVLHAPAKSGVHCAIDPTNVYAWETGNQQGRRVTAVLGGLGSVRRLGHNVTRLPADDKPATVRWAYQRVRGAGLCGTVATSRMLRCQLCRVAPAGNSVAGSGYRRREL